MAFEAAAMIEYATQNFPDVLGEENQYNDIISEGKQHTSAAQLRESRMKNWLGLRSEFLCVVASKRGVFIGGCARGLLVDIVQWCLSTSMVLVDIVRWCLSCDGACRHCAMVLVDIDGACRH